MSTKIKLLSPYQASQYLGVSRMTLYRWRRRGLIKSVKLNHDYFEIEELDRIKAQKPTKK